MKKQKINLNYKNKKIKLEIYKVPWWYEGIGLMFTRKETAKALLFSFKRSTRMSIFSIFIPYDFIAIWLDKNKKIIEIKVVKKGESGVLPSRKFNYLIEVPMTKNYDEVIRFLVG